MLKVAGANDKTNFYRWGVAICYIHLVHRYTGSLRYTNHTPRISEQHYERNLGLHLD